MEEALDLMSDFLETVIFEGDVRPWRDVPETDTSEDEPQDGSRALGDLPGHPFHGNQWTDGGGRFVDDVTQGRAILDKGKLQATKTSEATIEEAKRQETLAEAQRNPLAHPPFVLGQDNAISNEITRYVAAYGQEFTPGSPPDEYGQMKECYRNASLLVMSRTDLTYAEGFATSKKTGNLAFMHGWAVDKDNRVVDPTWHDGTSYFGVKYDRSKYLQQLYKAKFYGVMAAKFKAAQYAIATGGSGLRANP